MSKLTTLLLLPLFLAACGSPPPDQAAHRRTKGIQFSPNAEPLDGGALGPPRCEDAMAQWFARVDTNHDGGIDRQEFLADTHAQFARMDLDHDGFITADELWTFRQPHVQAPPRKKEGDGKDKGNAERHGSMEPAHAVTAGVADPVMSADTNLDFRVSLAEFLAQADSVFAAIDKDHNGRLSLAEIQAHDCTPQPNHPIPVEQ